MSGWLEECVALMLENKQLKQECDKWEKKIQVKQDELDQLNKTKPNENSQIDQIHEMIDILGDEILKDKTLAEEKLIAIQKETQSGNLENKIIIDRYKKKIKLLNEDLSGLAILVVKLPVVLKIDRGNKPSTWISYLQSLGYDITKSAVSTSKISPLSIFKSIKFSFDSRDCKSFCKLCRMWVLSSKKVNDSGQHSELSRKLWKHTMEEIKREESNYYE